MLSVENDTSYYALYIFSMVKLNKTGRKSNSCHSCGEKKSTLKKEVAQQQYQDCENNKTTATRPQQQLNQDHRQRYNKGLNNNSTKVTNSKLNTKVNRSDVGECAKNLSATDNTHNNNQVDTNKNVVYFSLKQSSNVEDVPGAPPCTPIETLSNGVASLAGNGHMILLSSGG